MSSTQVAITLIVIVLLAVVVVGAVFLMRRQTLRQRFGPEYDRVVAEQGRRARGRT